MDWSKVQVLTLASLLISQVSQIKREYLQHVVSASVLERGWDAMLVKFCINTSVTNTFRNLSIGN